MFKVHEYNLKLHVIIYFLEITIEYEEQCINIFFSKRV